MAASHRARAPSLTEFPDSPSVYSYAYHSPDPYPDCDDETASTIRSFSADGIQGGSDLDDCTDDASHRISLRGPKIRFHSRAPWETEDVVPHAEELDGNARSATTGNKPKAKTSRADSLIRTFTRGPSIDSRPSVDSTRSRVSAASSFETTAGDYSSSRGALYDLARQLSSSSLTSSATSTSSRRSQSLARTTGQTKYSHYCAQSYDSVSRTTVSLDGMVPAVTILKNVPVRPSSSDVSRVGYERTTKLSLVPSSQERQSRDMFTHPYANPDLVAAYTSSPEMIPPHHPILGDISRSDSAATDSTSTRSAAFSHTSVEVSTTSTFRDVSHGNLRVNGKEISSPVSVLRQGDHSYVDRSTRFLSLHPPPVGFEGPFRNNLNSRSPTVALISLREAQAKERLRSSTVHATVPRRRLPFPSSDNIAEITEDETVETDTGGKMVHTRARSTSAGTRHNTVPLPSAQPQDTELRDESAVYTSGSAVSGRTLKHKKSGFMRLFGGRSMEGDKERSTPPPIPPLADAYTEEVLPMYGTAKTSKLVLPKASKSSPALRGAGASNATLALMYSVVSDGDGADGKVPSSRRRQPPLLSIVTKTSDPSIPESAFGTSSPIGLDFTPSSPFLAVPQSAPPRNSDFPGLKLRPVSTSFSSHFAGMVACTAEELQGVHTPSSVTSSNTSLSPFTPVSTRRSDDTSATAVEAPGEDPSTVKALQDQFVSAQKAWQQQVWELRGQIRDLTSELEDLRAEDDREYCEVCGRGEPRKRHAPSSDEPQQKKVGVVNRPRARTGDTARFASGN